MYIQKNQIPILVFNAIVIVFFTFNYLHRGNTEFLIYLAVVIFFATIILLTLKSVQYTNGLLWGLTMWVLLHMSGGLLYFGETRLYEVILLPISETYEILKYDQFVHMFGFCVATLVMHHVLKRHLKNNHLTLGVAFILVMVGNGLGALNESVEFMATVFSSSTGVGGYQNTSLDLISNLIGAVLAVSLLKIREKKR